MLLSISRFFGIFQNFEIHFNFFLNGIHGACPPKALFGRSAAFYHLINATFGMKMEQKFSAFFLKKKEKKEILCTKTKKKFFRRKWKWNSIQMWKRNSVSD
jgi:hypothetical protein